MLFLRSKIVSFSACVSVYRLPTVCNVLLDHIFHLENVQEVPVFSQQGS